MGYARDGFQGNIKISRVVIVDSIQYVLVEPSTVVGAVAFRSNTPEILDKCPRRARSFCLHLFYCFLSAAKALGVRSVPQRSFAQQSALFPDKD